ncbi:MAG: ATP-dependent RecD-like DNA helicase [Clostridia bacterium]|nr:ATP-dependent RecD-like DNA helicase [Clostridia bacterium]
MRKEVIVLPEKEYEKISGVVETIIFNNEENGYTVAEIENDDYSFVAVGTMFGIAEGEKVILTGRWIDHPTYGEQFKTEMYEKQMPTGREEILKYLSSGIIKGVRKATAKKIVERFGEETLNIIASNPASLALINGISEKKALEIGTSYAKQLGTSELFMFLQNYGISTGVCMKIYRKHNQFSKDIILHNPYVLCEGDLGVSFKKADEIAMANNISRTDDKRICAGIVYMLKYSLQFGHTYLPEDILVANSAELLGVASSGLDKYVDYLCSTFTCVRETKDEKNIVYLYEYYDYEKYIAKKIALLAKTEYDINDINVEKQVEIAQVQSSLRFDAMQKEAVKCAMKKSVMVITGGPGTGKTTIINAIIDIMKSMRLKVALTAPTGRAAKRMSQVCRCEAKTIHRLLEVSFSDGEDINCVRNEEDPLDADVIIVDEMSMVDISLMNSLLRATRPGTRLVLVGDVNQLPSVGAGNVLRDIIESKAVSVIRLNKIFRQSGESMIVTNAHAINEGHYPQCNVKDGGFYFATKPTPESGAEYICELCLNRLKNTYGFDPFDIQVLSPAKKGIAGVNNLNRVLQNLLNPPDKFKKEKSHADMIFREGDKVMQIKNNYDLEWNDVETDYPGSGVFNGDVGYVKEINHDFHEMTVIFDDKKVKYNFRDLSELTLAYCITVHKSQGSEFPAVVMPMFRAPDMLLTRNLLYTGVTRAKNLVVLVGCKDILERMVDNNREDKRYSALSEKLTEEMIKNNNA